MALGRLGRRQAHRFTQKNLSAYLDGRLSPRARRRVERHLAACSLCRRDLETLRTTVRLVRALPKRPAPRSFVLPLSVAQEQRRLGRWDARYQALRLAAASAAIALVLLGVGDWALRRGLYAFGGRAQLVAQRLEMPQSERGLALEAPVVATQELEQGGERPLAIQAQKAPAEATSEMRSLAAAPPTSEASGGRGEAASPADVAAQKSATPTRPAPGARMASPLALSPLTPSEPVPSPSLQATPAEKEAVARALAMPTPSPTEASRQTALSLPTRAPEVAVPSPEERLAAEPTPLPVEVSEQATDSSSTLPWLWRAWRVVRLAAAVLAGVLLMLLGGLLWAWQRRRSGVSPR